MSRGTYSGEDVIKMLQKWRFKRVDQAGSHVKLRYVHPEGEKRTVIVPLHDELDTGTLKSMAKQAGAKEFQAFLGELEELV